MTLLDSKGQPEIVKAVSTLKRLTFCLLFWVILLSVLQLITFTLLFTLFYPGPSLPSTPERSGPLAHLISKSSENNKAETVSWQVKGRAFSLQPDLLRSDHLEIPWDGIYYIYAQVSLHENCTLVRQATVTLLVKHEGRGSDLTALLRKDISCCRAGNPSSHYTAGQFRLSKGDSVFVRCQPPLLLNPDPQETYFGAFLMLKA
ncbi:tumor necrosis factor ligand superfamily member 11-like [Rhinatrema bivittatum]|uniref:tumor necrosis factor ligand superfamily member 11-like n=1 Tax=Rhinatrema bivittatum TaxID=194408 RepID=UPI0011298E56|nr:tumor necrosis factor ligand superfamily member 11-like [Rhinatrema bivittatum]